MEKPSKPDVQYCEMCLMFSYVFMFVVYICLFMLIYDMFVIVCTGLNLHMFIYVDMCVNTYIYIFCGRWFGI